MTGCEKVTETDLVQGRKFRVTMFDGSYAWIAKDEIILPGHAKPAKSKLVVMNCQVNEQLTFLYTDSAGKESQAKTEKRVRQIFAY